MRSVITLKSNEKHRRSVIGVVIGVVLGLMLLTTVVDARNLNPGILPPNSHSFGKTYSEWSAAWWQYVFSIPAAHNPLVDETGEDCNVGQSGKVFFLVGKLCVETTGQGCIEVSATRDCTVPAGKALFFPIANSENDNLGVNPPLTEEELREAAKEFIESVTNMTCEVDGVSIRGLDSSTTTPYRVVSPVFSYAIPDGNIYDLFGLDFDAQTVEGAVADGIFLMLAPLPVGQHVIHFTAEFAGGFSLDITYHITVAPGKK